MTDSSSPPVFRVFAQPLCSMDEEARELFQFPLYNSALKIAAQRVWQDLWNLTSPGQSAKELFDLWRTMGEDVFIVPNDPIRPFSATDFVRLVALQVTSDNSRPLLLEVTCTDCLQFSSGGSSPPKEWVFWVKAPATYANAPHLIRRATEYLYEEMSRPALASDGSSYTLLDLALRELSEAEATEILQNPADKTIYTVQNDGSLAK